MQIANTFDPETLGKIKRSALISAGGFVVAVLPMLLPQILQALSHYPILAAAFGAVGAWLVNFVREWLAGQPKQ